MWVRDDRDSKRTGVDDCVTEAPSPDATAVLGPNNATFSIELQEVSGANFPAVYNQSEYNRSELLSMRVGRTRVLPGGGERFMGLLEGGWKRKAMRDTTCHL